MQLTDQEKKMLDGVFGTGPQDAMQLLMTLGTVYNAERMIPVTTCHLGGRNVLLGGQENIDWMTDLYEGGARFRVFTSWNAGCCDFNLWKEMGLPEKLVEDQKRSDEIYLKLGAVPLGTCLPYYHGNLPMPGTSFAAGGSAGATFVNSMIGARGNREGSPSVVAASICGVTPEYGLHLKENRYGKVIVDLSGLDFAAMTLGDFSALGYYIGRTLVDKTPVIVGVPRQITQDQIRFLISPMPTGGAISLVHIVGVTPEAPTAEEALGHKKPEDTISVSRKDLQSSYETLTTARGGKVDLVTFGCPHCSIGQIQQIASLLDGKRIHPDTRLWVGTSRHYQMMAREMGYGKVIEKAGGLIIADVCVAPGAPFHLVEGVKTVAINSARGAYFIPGACGVEVIFSDTKECIEAAINGKWRAAV
jgi:predicted aconitase